MPSDLFKLQSLAWMLQIESNWILHWCFCWMETKKKTLLAVALWVHILSLMKMIIVIGHKKKISLPLLFYSVSNLFFLSSKRTSQCSCCLRPSLHISSGISFACFKELFSWHVNITLRQHQLEWSHLGYLLWQLLLVEEKCHLSDLHTDFIIHLSHGYFYLGKSLY